MPHTRGIFSVRSLKFFLDESTLLFLLIPVTEAQQDSVTYLVQSQNITSTSQ